MTGPHRKHERVRWTSRGVGRTGVVLVVLAPGETPRDHGYLLPSLGTAPRAEESYLVQGGGPDAPSLAVYWPRTASLEADPGWTPPPFEGQARAKTREPLESRQSSLFPDA